MNLNVEVNKRMATVLTIISSLVLTLLGFIINDYLDAFKTTTSEVNELKAKIIRIEEKANDDKTQWQILQDQSKAIQEQDVQLQVLRIRISEMSKNKIHEITVQIKGLNNESSGSVGNLVVPSPTSPDPVPNPPDLIDEPITIPSVIEVPNDKIKDLEKKINDLDKKENYEDFRRGQIIQRKAY